jgi:hypothetical protein
MSEEAAGKELNPSFEGINRALAKNPDLSREQARQIADKMPEGPRRSMARALADELPSKIPPIEHASAMGPETGNEPYLQNAPGHSQTAPTAPEAQTPVKPAPEAAAGQRWQNTGTQFRDIPGKPIEFTGSDGKTYHIQHLRDVGVLDHRVAILNEKGAEVAHAGFNKNAVGTYSGHVSNKGGPKGMGRALYDYAHTTIGDLKKSEATVAGQKVGLQTKEGDAMWARNAKQGKPPDTSNEGLVPQPAKPPEVARALVENVRGVAKQLGIDARGTQDAIEERIRKAGGQGFLDALTVGSNPTDAPALKEAGSSVEEVKRLPMEINHEIEKLSASTGRSAASIQREIHRGLSEESSVLEANAPGQGSPPGQPGPSEGPAGLHRPGTEAERGAGPPSPANSGQAGGDVVVAHSKESPNRMQLRVGGQSKGEISFGNKGGEDAVARRMFPGIVQEGQRVSRIHGIDVDAAERGKGMGQVLYLEGMASHGADWYYNSQAEPGATNALKSLASKGLIELHWKGPEPSWNSEGGVHIVRPTESGVAEIANRKSPQGDFLTQAAHPPEQPNSLFHTGNQGQIVRGMPEAPSAPLYEPNKLNLTPEQTEWGQHAVDGGLDPHRLHAEAAQILRNDAPLKEDVNNLRKDLFKQYPQLKTVQIRNAKGKIDQNSIRGLDDIAQHAIPPEYEHLFPEGSDREKVLFDILVGGAQKPMSMDAAYREAFANQWSERQRPEIDQQLAKELAPDVKEEVQTGVAQSAPEEAVHEGIQAGQRAGEAEALREAQEAAEGRGEADDSGGRPGEHGTFDPAELDQLGAAGQHPTDPGRPVSESERAGLPAGAETDVGAGGGRKQRLTALANQITDAERKLMGMVPREAPGGITNQETWDAARATLARDPLAARDLVQELKIKPRPTTVEENALLLHRKIALENEHERTMLQVIADGKPGAGVDAITMTANENREREMHDRVQELYDVIAKTGTESGRAFQFRAQLAAEDFSLAGMLRRAEAAKEKPLTPEEHAKIMELNQQITALQAKLAEAEKALEASGQGIKSPDFKDWQTAAADARRAQQEFLDLTGGYRQGAQPLANRMEDLLVKIRRAFVISSPKTMLKIIAASAERVAISPMEEIAGKAWAAIPGISKIAAMAPREGRGLSLEAEKTSLYDGFTQGMKDAWDNVRHGKSELDVLYGKDYGPRSWLDWVGQLHAAGKAPAVRAEFTRSFLQRIDSETAAGRDATTPAALLRIGAEAYKDSQRAKFQQDNKVVDAWKAGINKLKGPDASFGSRAIATGMQLAVPVIRIPTNIVAESFQYAFGTVTGGVRAAAALARGVENMKPEQADLIMRSLKKGSIGLAALGVGFFNPQIFGGFYSGRRDDREVQAGGIRVGNMTIPFWLLHNPLLEVLQMGATVRRAMDSTHRGEHPDFATAAASGILGIGEEVPMVREAMDLGRKAFSLNPRTRGQYFGELTKSLAVPQLFQWLAGRSDTPGGFSLQADTIKRRPEGVWQHIKTGLPGLRQTVPQ